MDKLGIDLRLLISQIVNFAIIFFLLSKFLYQPILKLLEERKKKISETYLNADKIKEELGKIEEEKKKIFSSIRKESEILVKSEYQEAQRKIEEQMEKAKNTAKIIIEEAKIEAEREKEEMMKEVAKRTSTLALSLTEKILTDLDNETQHKVIAGMIKNLKK